MLGKLSTTELHTVHFILVLRQDVGQGGPEYAIFLPHSTSGIIGVHHHTQQ